MSAHTPQGLVGASSSIIFHCHAIVICNIDTNPPPLHPIILSHYSNTQTSMEDSNESGIGVDGCAAASTELQGANREVSAAHFLLQGIIQNIS